MARLWTCGFELQSAAAGPEFSVVSGAPTISTTVHRAGAASLRSNPTAGTQYAEHQLDSGTVKRTLHRLYLRIGTLPSADCNIYGIGQSGYFPGLLRLTTTGTLTLRDGFTSTNLGSPTAALTPGQWYRIELDYTDQAGTLTAGVSAFKGYLDGVEFADTLCTNINGWARIRAGVQSAATADIYIDDIAVNDTTGSAQTGLPGPGSVVHLRPDSAGDSAGWATTVGGTANWQRVSEITPDDATTYNATVATGTTAIDDFNLDATATAGINAWDAVTLVQVGGRIGSDAATAASLVYRVKGQSGGTVTESASVSVALNGWATHKAGAPYPYQLTSYTNPQTGTAWTPAELDTAQIGYRANVSQTTARRVSALWALVEFVPGEEPEPEGTPLTDIVDDFDDDVIDPVMWPESYGDISETGGRARVPCTDDYAAYATAKEYTLTGSQLAVRLYPAAVGGATTECWSQVLVTTTTPGTDLTIECNALDGTLAMSLRVDYFDAAYTSVPYDPVDHAWLRVREDGGTLYWETAPDGLDWTTRRTATTPGWASDVDLQVQLIAHRSDGTPDFAEYDNVNVAPSGQTVPYGPAVEASGAGPLAVTKAGGLGAARSAAVARPIAAAKAGGLGAGRSADAARPLTVSRAVGLGAAHENASARQLTVSRAALLSSARTADTARPLVASFVVTLGAAREMSVARPVAATHTAMLGAARETDTAQPVDAARVLLLSTAREQASARPVTPSATARLGAAVDTATARSLDVGILVGLGAARSADVARLVAVAKQLLLGFARSADWAGGYMTAGATRLRTAAAVDAARPMSGSKVTAIAPAPAVDAVRPFTSLKASVVGPARTADAGRPLTSGKERLLAGARGQEVAGPLGAGKQVVLGTAREMSAARPVAAGVTGQLAPARTHDVVRPVTAAKRVALGPARTVDGARPVAGEVEHFLLTARVTDIASRVGAVKHLLLGGARERDQAHGLTAGRVVPLGVARVRETGTGWTAAKTHVLAAALVVDRAAEVGVTGRARLRPVTTVDRGTALRAGHTVRLGTARTVDRASPSRAGRAVPLGAARCLAYAGPVAAGKRRGVGAARAVARAGGVRQPFQTRRLHTATTADRASPIGWEKRRPADELTPSTSGPLLTASTFGPSLTVSTTGGG